MTEPSRAGPASDQTDLESRGQLDPTLARPDGEIVLFTQRTDPEPNFGPPEKPGETGTLGRYRVLKKLGQGGMGAVYLAHDTVLARRIALKVMLPRYAADTEARERFLREARAAAMVRSDHVVTIFDVGNERAIPFIAMEYLLGHPLDQYLRASGEIPLPQVVRIAVETALGLAAAHDLGLVHRDIKPGNLWLEAPHGRIKLLDFGLARAANDDTHLSTSGLVVGTPAYMSPEQARGLKLDGRSDLFSLGVLLYRLTTGKMPFAGTTTLAVLTSLAVDAPVPVRQLNPQVPEGLEAVIAKLLAKNPADRFATAGDVVAALRAAERPQPVAGELPVVVQAIPMAITAQSDNVWEGLDASESSPRVLESGTELVRAPTVRAARKRPVGAMSIWLAVLSVAGLIGASAGLAAFLFWPSKGTLVVESDDPDAELVVKKNGAIVRDRTTDREIELTTGTYTAELAAPKPGWRLSPDKFEITRKGETRVRVSADKPRPSNGKPSLPTLPADPDRKAAEFVRRIGGIVNVKTDPSATVVLVNLAGREGVTDADLAVFKDCTGITFLDLGSTQVSDAGLVYFKGCANLDTLSLHTTKVTDAGLVHLKEFENLVYLRLNENKGVTDAGIPALAACKNLGLLDLVGTKVSDDGVAKLKAELPTCVIKWNGGVIAPVDPDRRAVQYLVSRGGTVSVVLRDGSKVEVLSPAKIPRVPFRLVVVKAQGNPNLTDEGLAAVRGCRHITELWLHEVHNVTDQGFMQFEGTTTLQILVVSNTKITDTGLDVFKDCKDLTRLSVDNTIVSDEGLRAFKDHSKLTELGLGGTRLTDEGLAYFKDCKGLTNLDVRGTKVTDKGLAPFKEYRQLTQLFVQKSDVKNVEELHEALPRCRIEWNDGVFEPKK